MSHYLTQATGQWSLIPKSKTLALSKTVGKLGQCLWICKSYLKENVLVHWLAGKKIKQTEISFKKLDVLFYQAEFKSPRIMDSVIQCRDIIPARWSKEAASAEGGLSTPATRIVLCGPSWIFRAINKKALGLVII